MKIILDKYRFGRSLIVTSGRQLAEDKTYKKVVGKSGKTWYVPTDGDPSQIQRAGKYMGSKGYGGAILTFKLEDGTEDKVEGPWNLGAKNLLEDTGLDLTKNHMTQGIVALERRSLKHDYLTFDYEDVLHLDEAPVMGHYDRVSEIAQYLADSSGKRVFYQILSKGGGVAGTKEPQK